MATKKKAAAKAATKKPRQARLPGTEDAAIENLNALAEEYAEKRDARMAIGKEEVDLKGQILAIMHKHNKSKYVFDGISVAVKAENEKVIVRVKKEKEANDPDIPF